MWRVSLALDRCAKVPSCATSRHVTSALLSPGVPLVKPALSTDRRSTPLLQSQIGAVAAHDGVGQIEPRVGLREVQSLVRAAALLARERAGRDHARERERVAGELGQPLLCALEPG